MEDEELFDLNDFEVATKSNPRVEKTEEKVVEKKAKAYNVKANFKTRHVSFDTEIAKEINLEANSLTYAKSKSGRIAIIVVPGNQGVFAKKMEGAKKKGTSFKHKLLIADLVELNLTSGTYLITKKTTGPAKIGSKVIENCDWYDFTMVGEPKAIDLTESEKEEVPEVIESVTSEPENNVPQDDVVLEDTSVPNQKF